MPRISIAAFRTRLVGRAQAEPLTEACRALTHRPDVARRAHMSDWPVWSDHGTGR